MSDYLLSESSCSHDDAAAENAAMQPLLVV